MCTCTVHVYPPQHFTHLQLIEHTDTCLQESTILQEFLVIIVSGRGCTYRFVDRLCVGLLVEPSLSCLLSLSHHHRFLITAILWEIGQEGEGGGEGREGGVRALVTRVHLVKQSHGKKKVHTFTGGVLPLSLPHGRPPTRLLDESAWLHLGFLLCHFRRLRHGGSHPSPLRNDTSSRTGRHSGFVTQ